MVLHREDVISDRAAAAVATPSEPLVRAEAAEIRTRAANHPRIIRRDEVKRRVGLSDATIWRLEGSGQFPQRLALGGNSVGWLEEEIDRWLLSRPRKRRLSSNGR